MIAVDSSVAVAALLDWHDAHIISRRAGRGASIPAHALAETFSVLTRLPQPLAAGDAARLLEAAFPRERVLTASARLQRAIPGRCAGAGVAGGAVSDAVIALTAAEHGARLLTRDDRAARVYEMMGVEVLWV